MRDESMVGIRKEIHHRHQAFIEKIGSQAGIALSQDLLEHELTLAKIRFIANALLEEGVVDQVSENNIFAFNKFFPCSLNLSRTYPSLTVTILNGGNDLIVVDGIIRQDVLSQSLHFSKEGEPDSGVKIFENVAQPSFDWQEFSVFLLDFIHQVMYKRKELLNKIL